MNERPGNQILFQQLGEPTVEVIFDDETPIVREVNEAFEGVFDVTSADIVGDSLDSHIVPPEDHDAQEINREAARGQYVEQEVCRETPDGPRWFLFRSVPFLRDGEQCGYGIYIDITERKQQQSRFEELIRNSSDVISVLDASGTVEYQSPSVEHVFGYSPEEMIGENAFAYVHQDDREEVIAEFTQAVEGSPTTPKIQYRFRHANGSWHWVESVGNNQLANPAVEGFVVNSRDITSRVEKQQELRLLKQVFSRVFRHNIRNELNVIEGYVEVIENRETDEMDTPLEHIKVSTQQLLNHTEKARLIEQVIESRELATIDLRSCVDSVLGQFQMEAVTFVFDTEAPVRVTAHPKLEAVVHEVIDNAVRHAPSGHEPRVEVRIEEQDETVTLAIEDDSGGVGQSEIAVVAEGRESDLHHGSGVGLWLVRWIVERSNGSLTIRETDTGTVVEIELVHGDQS